MSETNTPAVAAPAPEAAPASPPSILTRLRNDVEAFAKQIGVDAEKLWTLVKEHM